MKPPFFHLIAPVLASAVLCSAAGLAHAEKADRDKPMNIEADALRHDDLRQTTVFTGRVVLTKGSIILRGERLEVRQTPDGYQSGTITAASGQRAFFRQKRDTAPGAVDEFIEGEAETIDYDGKADTVRLQRRAELRRYRGAALADELTGAVITYNNQTDVFSVDGTKPGAGGSRERVRAVLAPQPQRPGAAGPASVPAPGDAPTLRSSPRMGGAAP